MIIGHLHLTLCAALTDIEDNNLYSNYGLEITWHSKTTCIALHHMLHTVL